jgi:hypothetical protein
MVVNRNEGNHGAMKVDNFFVRRLVVLVPLLISILWAGSWVLDNLFSTPSFTCDTHIVDVQSGDTLYGIAYRHCVGDVDEVVGRLVAIYGTEIDTWQTVHLPVTSPRT